MCRNDTNDNNVINVEYISATDGHSAIAYAMLFIGYASCGKR